MNVTASHAAGGSLGGIAAVVLAALGTRIGLHLSDADSAGLAIGLLGVGAAIGHAIGKSWSGTGIFPSIRRGLFGP